MIKNTKLRKVDKNGKITEWLTKHFLLARSQGIHDSKNPNLRKWFLLVQGWKKFEEISAMRYVTLQQWHNNFKYLKNCVIKRFAKIFYYCSPGSQHTSCRKKLKSFNLNNFLFNCFSRFSSQLVLKFNQREICSQKV